MAAVDFLAATLNDLSRVASGDAPSPDRDELERLKVRLTGVADQGDASFVNQDGGPGGLIAGAARNLIVVCDLLADGRSDRCLFALRLAQSKVQQLVDATT